jgi:hypothetical protein
MRVDPDVALGNVEQKVDDLGGHRLYRDALPSEDLSDDGERAEPATCRRATPAA